MRDHDILPAKPCPMFPDTGFIRLATPPLFLYVFAAKSAPTGILSVGADLSANNEHNETAIPSTPHPNGDNYKYRKPTCGSGFSREY